MNGEYTLYLRNKSTGLRGDLVEQYGSLDITLNWGSVSKFTIKGSCIGKIPFAVGDCVLIYRNLELLISGMIESVEVECSDALADLRKWTASGKEDSVIFSQRIAFADPVNITFNSTIVDKVSGYADYRELYYIKRNMGSEALANRRVAGLTLPEVKNLGTKSDSAYRYKALDEIFKEIGSETNDKGAENNLYPVYVWDAMTGTKSVQIPTQRNRTSSVLLAPEFGNVISWKKKETMPKCNAVWVCSGDYEKKEEGTDTKKDNDKDTKKIRTWVYAEDSASIKTYGRIEKIVTKSELKAVEDDPDTDEDETVTEEELIKLLENEAKQYLEENAYSSKYTITMAETPDLQFMTHWRCGDLVSCIVDGEKFSSTIKTVEISYANGYEKVKPTVGENEEGEFSELFKMIHGLDERMDAEELS